MLINRAENRHLLPHLADLRLDPEDALVCWRPEIDGPVVQPGVLSHSNELLAFLQAEGRVAVVLSKFGRTTGNGNTTSAKDSQVFSGTRSGGM